MVNGRAYHHFGWHAVGIREPGPSGTYRNATTRELRVGESNRGGTLLDRDTFAIRLGKKDAGRELDGRTWDEMPLPVVA
jgi:protein gp37